MTRRLPAFPRALFGFGLVGLPAALVLLALGLAGCSHRTLQAGDLRASETAILTRNTLTATCTLYGPNGSPTSSTAIATESTGDTAMAHELLTGLGSILGGAAKTAPKPAAAPDAAGTDSACVLEHFKGESAPFPPQPPAQPPQQQSTHEPGDRPPTPAAAYDPSALRDRLALAAALTTMPNPPNPAPPQQGGQPQSTAEPRLSDPGFAMLESPEP